MIRFVATKKQTGFLLATCFGILFFLIPATSQASVLGFFGFDLWNGIGKLMYGLANYVGGSVLFLGALVLDISLDRLVIKMGTYFAADHQLGRAVTTGWVLIRDLINMTFIFGLIYIGIKTILNAEDAGTRRQLGYLMAAALLINFSLFLTQLMVDFSNLLSTQIYAQLISGSSPGSDGKPSPNDKAYSPISTKFLTTVGMSGLLNKNSVSGGTDDKAVINGGNLIFFSFLLLIFYILAGISFLLGAIAIVTRFVALLLYMIFSPIVFLGWILPSFAAYSSKWWENFWKYIFYAPIYLFMLYLSLQILAGLTGGPTTLGSASNAKDLTSLIGKGATVGLGDILMIFLVMIGLLWASLKIGDKLGIAGGKMAVSGFNRATRGVGNMGAGFAGWSGRNSLGWAGTKVADSDRLKEWANSKSATKRTLGRAFIKGADNVGSASFDARNTGLGKKAGLSGGQKGGYAKSYKDKVEREKKYAKLLPITEDTRLYEDAGVMHIHEANKTYEGERSKLKTLLNKTNDPVKRKELAEQIATLDGINIHRNASEAGKKYQEIKNSMKKEILGRIATSMEEREPILQSTKEAFQEAAKELRSSAGKSKNESSLDVIKAALDKADKKDD